MIRKFRDELSDLIVSCGERGTMSLRSNRTPVEFESAPTDALRGNKKIEFCAQPPFHGVS